MSNAIITYLQEQLPHFLADLQQLVSLDSYSYDREDVNQVVDWVEKRVQSIGFLVQRFPNADAGDDLLATRRGTGQGRVLLLGHSDTVFPRGTTAARPMRIEGDAILGPGTADMKSGYLAGIYAAQALTALGMDSYDQLGLLIVSDEEIDERHAVPLIRRVCRDYDAVLTLEAARANGDIVTTRKGVYAFQAEAFGKAAHSGVEPEKGRNAIVALAHMIIQINQLNDLENGISLNVGVIEGGRLRNIVPDYARIRFEMRAFTQEDLDRVTRQIMALFEQQPVPGVTFQVTYEPGMPPMPRTPAIAQLEAMAIHIADELGFPLKGAKTGGVADANYVAAEGIPVLDGLGPIGGLDHGPDEYILKDSIVPRTALLARLIQSIGADSSLHRSH